MTYIMAGIPTVTAAYPAKAGKTKQSTFTFQLVVTDLETGLAIWRAQKEIIKQGRKRSAVGW